MSNFPIIQMGWGFIVLFLLILQDQTEGWRSSNVALRQSISNRPIASQYFPSNPTVSITSHKIFNWPISFPGSASSKTIQPVPTPQSQTTSTSVKWSSIIIEDYRRKGKQCSEIKLESLGLNTRKIAATLTVDSSMEKLWEVLTDYNNLASIVPNLVQSYEVKPPIDSKDKDRLHQHLLYQEGAQKIMGFDFKAGLTMEMMESCPLYAPRGAHEEWKIDFKCVNSLVFDMFEGVWRLSPVILHQGNKVNRVKLSYAVTLKPKGPFPVMALECRIKEDIPVNLYALKVEAEKRFHAAIPS